MSLFGQYVRELGKEIVEDDRGFATFYEFGDGIYIEDIYVIPEFRNENVASQMADLIVCVAKERGLTKLYGTVKPTNKGSTVSLKVLLGYGFKLESSINDAIGFVKEI